MGLPDGGVTGGAVVDPKELSPHGMERLSRAFILAIADFIGPETGVSAPGMDKEYFRRDR